jgi:hypothetical protein
LISSHGVANVAIIVTPRDEHPPALEMLDDDLTRRPVLTDEEKLELVSEYMRKELRWGITEYLKSVMESSSTGGGNRRIAFTKFAYKDPKALQFYLGTKESMTVNQRRSREHIMKHTKAAPPLSEKRLRSWP